MVLVPWRHNKRSIDALHRELQRDFDRLFSAPSFMRRAFEYSSDPRMDIVESDDAFVAKVDLPGVDKQDIDIHVQGRTLTLRGTYSEDEEKKDRDDKKYYRRESRSGSFERRVSLPEEVDEEKVTAKTKDGVLTIELPKREEFKRRKIEVNVA